MSALRRALCIGLLAGLFAGCTAVRLSSLQGDYHDLVAAKARCQADAGAVLRAPDDAHGLASGDAVMPDCDVSGDLLELSREAEEQAGGMRVDRRTRIAYLRVASLAAWQAGDLEHTVALGLSGQNECGAIGADEFGAPRDCAILTGVGALAQTDLTSRRIDAIEPQRIRDPDAWVVEAAEVKQRLEASAKNLQQARSHIREISGVDPSVTGYFDRQYRLLYCNYANLAARAFGLRRDDVKQAYGEGLCEIQRDLDEPHTCGFAGDVSRFVDCTTDPVSFR